jgi:hypothetical protein
MPPQRALRKTSPTTALFVLLALAVVTSPGWAPPSIVLGSESDLRVEWEVDPTARGPVIAGYLLNDSGTAADKVILRIEGLDEAGRVVNSRVAFVFGTVPAFNRTYFEVSMSIATSYRVSISSFQWIKGGGGGGGM